MLRPFELPHHDGSSLYMSNPYPTLGEVVSLFVRVPHRYPVESVHVRWVWDGEPKFAEGSLDRTDGFESWWRVDLEVRNPMTNYRFVFGRQGHGAIWLNALGLVERDPLDWSDFRLLADTAPPEWARLSVFYQIFIDRFARGGSAEWPEWAEPASWSDPVVWGGPEAMRQLYGGDLMGIAQRLDYIEELGANAIYLTPFFPAPSNHRYNASTFHRVDPALGGDEALSRLTAQAHERGMKVIGDITLNHCGDTHEWFAAAVADPGSVEASCFYIDGRTGAYETWLGVPTLPKFDVRSSELRKRLFEGPDSVVARWMRSPYDLDGWRVDVANMVGRSGPVDENHAVSRTVRHSVTEANREGFLVAEHAHDATADLVRGGWHGIMNYTGFTRPVWRWLTNSDPEIDYLGHPLDLHRLDGPEVAEMMQETRAAISWQAATYGLNLLGSHDTARIRSVVGDAATHHVAATLLMTTPGIPMVFAGDEVGITGKSSEAARQPMPWNPEVWDHQTRDQYRTLISLRRANPALHSGGFRWIYRGRDSLVYLRETADQRFLVQLNRTPTAPLGLPLADLGATILGDALGDGELVPEDGLVTLPGDGPAAWLWEIDPDGTG